MGLMGTKVFGTGSQRPLEIGTVLVVSSIPALPLRLLLTPDALPSHVLTALSQATTPHQLLLRRIRPHRLTPSRPLDRKTRNTNTLNSPANINRLAAPLRAMVFPLSATRSRAQRLRCSRGNQRLGLCSSSSGVCDPVKEGDEAEDSSSLAMGELSAMGERGEAW